MTTTQMGQYTAKLGGTKKEGPPAEAKATAPSTRIRVHLHTHVLPPTHSGLQKCNRRHAAVAHREQAGWFPDAPPGTLTKDIMCWVGTFQRQPVSSVAAVFLARSDMGDVDGKNSPLFHMRTAVESSRLHRTSRRAQVCSSHTQTSQDTENPTR